MPPTPGEAPSEERTKYEAYKPSLEARKEVVDDLLERFGGEAAEKTRELRKHTTEISKLLVQLAKIEKQSSVTEDELDAITSAIDTVQRNFDTELVKIKKELHDMEQEGTSYEKIEHTIFVVARSELLDTIDGDIKDAEGLNAKLRNELKALRKKILDVTFNEEDEEKLALAVFKNKEKKDPDPNTPDDVSKFQAYLVAVKKKNDAEKEKILATIEQEITAKRNEIIQEQQNKDDKEKKEKDAAHDEALVENAQRDAEKKKEQEAVTEKKAVEAKQKADQKVSARAGRARLDVQRALGGEGKDPKEMAEKLKAHLPDLLNAVFKDFTGDPRQDKQEIEKEKIQLILQVAWEILGKTGLAPEGYDAVIRELQKPTNTETKDSKEFAALAKTLDDLVTATKLHIEQTAQQRIAAEKDKAGRYKTMAKSIATYGGAGIVVKIAAGTALLNPFSSLVLGVGMVGIAGWRLGATALEIRRGKKEIKKVAEEYRENTSERNRLAELLVDSFIVEQNKKQDEDRHGKVTFNIDGKSEELSFEDARKRIGQTLNKEERNEYIRVYKGKVLERSGYVRGKDSDGNDIDIEGDVHQKIREQIEKENEELPKNEQLTEIQIEELADSTVRLYVIDQMNKLAEAEVTEQLSKGILRRGVEHFVGEKNVATGAEWARTAGKKVGEQIPTFARMLGPEKELDQRFRTAAVMGTLGCLARFSSELRTGLLSFAGLKGGSALGELGMKGMEKWGWVGKGEVKRPTVQDINGLRESILAAYPANQKDCKKLLDTATIQMAEMRVYLRSKEAQKRILENAEMERSLEELEQMLVAQSALLKLDEKTDARMFEEVRKSGERVIAKERRHQWARLAGAAAGVTLGFLGGQELSKMADHAAAAHKGEVDKMVAEAGGVEESTGKNLTTATEAAATATKNLGLLKTLAENKDWSNSQKTLHDLQEEVGKLTTTTTTTTTTDTPADALKSVVAEADTAAQSADSQLHYAMEAAARAHQSADVLGHAQDIGIARTMQGQPSLGTKALELMGFDSEKAKIAHEALAHAQAADRVVQQIAAQAAEAHQAAGKAHALQEQIQHALETKETGEVFSDALRQEYGNRGTLPEYHPINDLSPSSTSAVNNDRWLGGEWNADGKGSGEQLRYSLGAKNFMHEHGISVDEKTGKLILGHDNENITFRGSGAPIRSIEIRTVMRDLDGDGKPDAEWLKVTSIGQDNNVRVMYIRADGQYHGDRSGDVPNTGSWESQTNTAARIDGEQYMPTGALGKGDIITKLEHHEVAGSGGFISASEMRGADGVARQLHLLDNGTDGINADDVTPAIAQYSYEELGRDGHTVVDQGALTPDGRTSYTSIAEAQKAMGYTTNTLDVSNATTEQAVNALKRLQDHPVTLTADHHTITFADAHDPTHITTAKLDVSRMGSEVTAVVDSSDATKVDIKVGSTVVIDNATLSRGADGSLLIDGKALEAHTEIGAKILEQDIDAHLSNYTGHEAAAQALGVHVENNHLVIPAGVDVAKLNTLLADTTGKLNACGTNAEHLRYALEHETVTAPALTAIFENPAAQIPPGTEDTVLNKVFGNPGIIGAIKSGEAINQHELAFALRHDSLSDAVLTKVLNADLPPGVLTQTGVGDADFTRVFETSSGAIFEACKTGGVVNPEHVAFALGHDSIDAAELTALVKEQTLFHAVLEKPVSLEQAQQLQTAFQGIDLHPTVDGQAINFEYMVTGTKYGFVMDHAGVHLKGEGGHIVEFPLTKDPAELPLDVAKIGDVKHGLEQLVTRAAAEQGYAKQLEEAISVGGKADVNLDQIMDMRYGDTQGKELFFKTLGVREQGWDPRSWFGAGVSANRTYNNLTQIFGEIQKGLGASFNDDLTVGENVRLALEKKFE